MRGSQGGSPGSPEPCQGSAWVLFHQQLVCPAACPGSGASLGGLIPLGWVTAGDSPELAPPFCPHPCWWPWGSASHSSCWPPALQGLLWAFFSLFQRLWEAMRSSEEQPSCCQTSPNPRGCVVRAWGMQRGSCEPGEGQSREKSGKSSSRRVLLLGQGGIQALAGLSWWSPWWRVGGLGSRGGCCTLQPSRELSALVYVPGIIKIPGTVLGSLRRAVFGMV